MNTSLKKLAAVGAVGCAALSIAQIASRSDGGSSAPGGAHQGARATVNGRVFEARGATKGGYKAEPMTKVQELVVHYIIDRQNYLIEKYNDERVTTNVIFGQCQSILTAMTRQQQLHEIYDVWDVDVWRPGTEWETMKDVPSLANAILHVDPKVEAAIGAFDDKVTNEWMKPMRDFESTPQFRAMSYDAQVQALRDWSARQYAGVSMTERANRAVQRVGRVLEFARPLLTAAQNKEVDEIISRFEKKMDAAVKVAPKS